jgi:broad specificity phosphatase PhoE
VVTLVHLVRHGHHRLLGHVLCGRMPGVVMDEQGCREINAVADVLQHLEPTAIQCSPQQRALQSAAIIAARCGGAIEIIRAMDEIDMGRWTGARFQDIEHQIAWQRWNAHRGRARPPSGETMSSLQRRVVAHIRQLGDREGSVVIVSHAEPIRAALMHYLDVPLDLFHSIDIDTASISTIALAGQNATVSRVNHKVAA